MSVQAISWVIDQSKHKGNTFVVLLMIANHARSDGSGAWPSIHTIAKESRLADRTVQRCIKRLTRAWSGVKGWQGAPPELKVLVGKGPYGSNLYDIPGVKLSPPRCQSVSEGVTSSDTPPVTELCHPIRPLTVHKDKEELFQLIDDYHQGKTKTDEQGRRYKVSPSTRERVYAQ